MLGTHIVEDVEISMQRVSSGRGSAIVGNLDSIVKRIQVDATQGERHLGRVQPEGASCASCICDERCCEKDGRSPRRMSRSSLKKCTMSVVK